MDNYICVFREASAFRQVVGVSEELQLNMMIGDPSAEKETLDYMSICTPESL
jgi:hypothetical protein